MGRKASLASRLAANSYVSETGCVLWKLSKDSCGYGVIAIESKPRKAHRVAWEIANGPIPAELEVMHICDTPACINIQHLKLGTHAENMLDSKLKGRNKASRNKGIRNPSAALNPEKVAAIRASTEKGCVLAEKYRVSQATISFIRNNKRWRDGKET